MKFAVTVLFAVIATVVGFAAPDASPDQLANRYPAAAVATTVAVEPPSYVPAPVTVPPPAGLADTVKMCVLTKLAVTALSLLMMTDTGLGALLPTAPDQLAKRYPAAGVAVSFAALPSSYVPAPLTVPA
jgi:hypothetical protein